MIKVNGQTIHFGAEGGSTFIDHKDPVKKAAWIARHKNDKGWDDPTKGIFYSRHLLWGDTPDLKKQMLFLKKLVV